MHNILLPVDGSESSEHAVKYVIALVKGREPCQVQLINVQLPVRADEMNQPALREAIMPMLESAGEKALKRAKELLSASGITYTARTLVGEPAQAIARHAKEQSCDSIVMDTRGLGAIGGLVLGSVATKVIHLAEVPVTLVK